MFTYTYLDEMTLQDVESKRLAFKKIDITGLLVVCILWGYFIYSVTSESYIFHLPLFIPIITTGVVLFLFIRNIFKYTIYYKECLVTPNVKRNFPDFLYEPKGKVPEDLFRSSQMFSRFNRYSGDDYFKSNQMEFSELDVTYSTSSGNSSSTQTIFQGVFLVSVLPFSVSNPITIKKRINLDKVPKVFLPFIPKWMKNPQNVQVTGNSKFDELFLLQSMDPNVKEIMNNSVINHILKLGEDAEAFKKHPLQAPVILSIVSNKLYMGVSGVKLFKVKYNKSVRSSAPELEKSIKIIRDIINLRVILDRDRS